MNISDVKRKIEEYVEILFFMHDMSVFRNESNRHRADRIIAKCMEDLKRHDGLLENLKNDKQIEYFVRQTILYMV